MYKTWSNYQCNISRYFHFLLSLLELSISPKHSQFLSLSPVSIHITWSRDFSQRDPRQRRSHWYNSLKLYFSLNIFSFVWICCDLPRYMIPALYLIQPVLLFWLQAMPPRKSKKKQTRLAFAASAASPSADASPESSRYATLTYDHPSLGTYRPPKSLNSESGTSPASKRPKLPAKTRSKDKPTSTVMIYILNATRKLRCKRRTVRREIEPWILRRNNHPRLPEEEASRATRQPRPGKSRWRPRFEEFPLAKITTILGMLKDR